MCTYSESTGGIELVSNDSNNFWSSLGIELVGAILFLLVYEFIFKNGIAYFRTYRFKGVYLHCGFDKVPIMKDGLYCYSIIKTGFFKPYKFTVISKDVTSTSSQDWIGHYRIDPDSLEYANGTYRYLNQEVWAGTHHLFVMSKDVISVTVNTNTNRSIGYLFVRDRENKSAVSH